jgi:hypothetical protein
MAERLDKLAAVRTEMARIYREVRRGKLESQEGTRLVYMLKEIRACLESEMLVSLEERMASIQDRTQPRLVAPLSNGGSLINVPARLG